MPAPNHQEYQGESVGSINLKGVETSIALTPVTATILRLSVYPSADSDDPSETFDGPDIKPRVWGKPAAVLTRRRG